MALRAIAAGDSLACRADVPPELGDLRQLAFDAAAERAGRVDQRRRVAGQVGAIDAVARSVLVHWPIGELTAGRWRVQVRASSVRGEASTFVLDEELVVEPSLLPTRLGVIIVRASLPPMILTAQGQGARRFAVAQIRLASMRLTAQGQDARPIVTVRLRLAPMRLAAVGSRRTVATAVLRLPPMRTAAAGSGLRPLASAVLRLPALHVEVRGYGHIGTGVVEMRLAQMRLSASGNGVRPQGIGVLSLPPLRLTAAGDGGRPPAAGPSTPGAEVGPGANPGEVMASIVAPPSNFGDALVQGDGLGVITNYVTSIAGVEVTHDTTTLPIVRTTGGHAEGVRVPVLWWALGSGGRAGLAGSALVYPAITPPPVETIIGLVDRTSGRGLVDRTSGRGLVILPPS